ncbi:MAG TPA: Hsp33 family molecular chaperone HslO [Rhizomicrobium sp.]|jgi:molecular chaperone Hsp33|nr:Hsp33 family molecular chaperone HslO [Rhizomicrobium sp.]
MPDKMDLEPSPYGDFVLPFDIARCGVRGRLVRLDAASARALGAHVLPEPAARVTGEMVALGALLGTALKLDGRLTIQTKGDGPLDLVTADYYGADETRDRGVRGYARLDAERFAALEGEAFDKLAGKGALAITIEPRLGGKTYQGIVELSPQGIGASAETYFLQSEQLPTVIRLAAAPLYVAGDPVPHWRAGGLMLQMTPESASRGQETTSDDWDRLSLLLNTVEDVELVDTSLKPETLLWRLFHEEEVRVAPPERVIFRCDCDAARVTQVLKRYTPQEREGLADPDGVIRARCEFCGKTHEIGPDGLA